jgi:hypothetical protein
VPAAAIPAVENPPAADSDSDVASWGVLLIVNVIAVVRLAYPAAIFHTVRLFYKPILPAITMPARYARYFFGYKPLAITSSAMIPVIDLRNFL